ncbi:MAG TPA: SRPBCC family protein [Sphingomicrobium sp.]|jgi:uncharacterized membrane protein|nr:SRPBCC family protein [Sphingomicrobium sp.]
MASNDDRSNGPSGTQKALIGAAVAAGAGAAAFFFARRSADMDIDGPKISDAPEHTMRDPQPEALVGRTVSINKPRQELYERWRDFTRFPDFMHNVERVITEGDGSSRWTMKAPTGETIDLVTRITEDKPAEAIAWESTPESEIETEGRVEFSDGPPRRGTIVRLQIRYDPPGGTIGRGIAKLLQREPNIQARRDLRRFKQLMETGEVTTNAGPSGRDQPVTESHI